MPEPTRICCGDLRSTSSEERARELPLPSAHRGWLMAAEVELPGFASLVAVSVHARILEGYVRPNLDRAFDALEPLLAGRSFVLGGDLNLSRNYDTVYGTTHHTEFLDGLAARGYFDCMRKFLNTVWRASPDMTFELLAGPYVIPGEPRAAFHWRGWGTHTGPLDPPGFAPTGRRWEIDGVDFHEYRDGRVFKLRIAFDMMSVSRQLGLSPESGSRVESALAMVQRSAARIQQAIRERRA